MIEIALAAALATQEPLGGLTIAPANEEAAVIATVEQLFDAMRRHDVDAFSALLVPDGNTFRVNQGPTEPAIGSKPTPRTSRLSRRARTNGSSDSGTRRSRCTARSRCSGHPMIST